MPYLPDECGRPAERLEGNPPSQADHVLHKRMGKAKETTMKYKYFIAEGPQKAFEKLWNSICGKKPGCSWEDNPCVRAVEFEIKEASHE